MPVIILTNLTGDDEQRNRDVAELKPSYYLVKTDLQLKDIIEKVKERLDGKE